MVDAQLEAAFPNLAQSGYRVTSPASRAYNCIAWAAGDDSRWWWPAPSIYWPPQAPRVESLEAFVQAYGALGYEPCEKDDLEAGFEKVALYADSTGKPTHAARQFSSGRWTSKVGRGVDIEHESLDGLSGELYGTPVQILRRPMK